MSGKAGCGPSAADFFPRMAGSSGQSGGHGPKVESGQSKDHIFCLACYRILYIILFLRGFLKDRGPRPATGPSGGGCATGVGRARCDSHRCLPLAPLAAGVQLPLEYAHQRRQTGFHVNYTYPNEALQTNLSSRLFA